MTLNKENKQSPDKGIQPLDEIMKQLELNNSDLVKCPGGMQITYQKQYMLTGIFNY